MSNLHLPAITCLPAERYICPVASHETCSQCDHSRTHAKTPYCCKQCQRRVRSKLHTYACLDTQPLWSYPRCPTP